LRKDAINKYFKTNTWETAQERSELAFVVQKQVLTLIHPSQNSNGGKISACVTMKCSFSLEGGGVYLLYSLRLKHLVSNLSSQ